MPHYTLKCFLGNKAYAHGNKSFIISAFHNFKTFVMNHNFDLKLWDFNWTIQGCLQVEIKHSLCLPYRLKGWTQLLTFVTLSNTPSENRALVEYGGGFWLQEEFWGHSTQMHLPVCAKQFPFIPLVCGQCTCKGKIEARHPKVNT